MDHFFFYFSLLLHSFLFSSLCGFARRRVLDLITFYPIQLRCYSRCSRVGILPCRKKPCRCFSRKLTVLRSRISSPSTSKMFGAGRHYVRVQLSADYVVQQLNAIAFV